MQFLFTLFLAALFFVLTPGVLVSIPKSGSLRTKALVHALVFAVVFHLVHPFAMKYV